MRVSFSFVCSLFVRSLKPHLLSRFLLTWLEGLASNLTSISEVSVSVGGL